MKFRVGREALGDAVAFVSRALPSRPVVPLLSGMLLQADLDCLSLSCFDYEVSARITVEAEIIEPGTALVPGRLLAEITRSLPARPAEFTDDGDAVTLTCGSAEFGLVCLPVQDYPALPESPPSLGAVDGGVLAAAVGQVVTSASRDDTLPMLTAVCLDISDERMTLVATDRYRLAAREVPFAPAVPGLRAIALVPAKVMAETARSLPSGVPATIAFGAGGVPGGTVGGSGDDPHPADGLISFQAGDRRLTARLIPGEFIRYRTRFNGEFSCQADLPAESVIEAVRRASLVAERAGPVRLSFRPGHVVIEAHAEGRARAAETVPADFSGDTPAMSFNPHFLLDGLVAAASVGSSAGQPGAQQSDAGRAGDADRPAAGTDTESVADAVPAEPAGLANGENAGGDAEHRSGSGRIRLRFNTPAKPALITWADPDSGRSSGSADGHPAGARADESGSAGDTAFRYLLVPLRVPTSA